MSAKLVVLAGIVFATSLDAQVTNRWTNNVAGTWLWQTPENWSAGAPASSHSCFITNAGPKTVRITGAGPGSSSTISNLTLSAPAGSTNILQLDDFESPGVFYIRNSFSLTSGGAFVQNAATTRVEAASLLPYFTVDGSVWLNGGWLITTNFSLTTVVGYSGAGQLTTSNGVWSARSVYIGYLGGSAGTLTVAGGTNSIPNVFYVGRYAGSTGTLWVTGGALFATNSTTVYLGDAGVGRLTVSNGVFNSGSLVAGSGGGTGSVLVAGGTLSTGYLTIGNSYTDVATLTVAGGSAIARNELHVGSYGPGNAWITGGELITTNGKTAIAEYYPGSVTLSNGTWRAREVYCGYSGTGVGTITIAGGTALIGSTLTLGTFLASATGTLWVIGGELCVTTLQTYVASIGTARLSISNATYRAGEVYVGWGGNGTFTFAGGTNTMNVLQMAGGLNTTGTVWLIDGLITMVSTGYTSYVGLGGAGRMTVSNGLWDAEKIWVGVNSGSSGSLTIAGGEVRARGIVTYGGMLLGYAGCNATGAVTVTGGSLFVTNASHDCVLEVRSGTLTIAGGYVQADKIVITNACGHFARSGGAFVYNSAILVAARDDDGDGIPNAYDLDPFDPSDAGTDPDGDGQSNLAEYVAGTNPTNAASSFRIISIVPDGDDIRVSWLTGLGRTNALQRSSVVGTGFADIFSVTNATSTTTNYLDHGAATNSPANFYRVRLIP